MRQRRKARRGAMTIVALLIAGLLAACGTTGAPEGGSGGGDDETFTLRYAHGYSPESFTGKLVQQWADLVGKKTGGKVKVKVYPSGQLYDFPDIPQAVSGGTVDAGMIMSTYGTDLLPAWGFPALPFLIGNNENAQKLFGNQKLQAELNNLFEGSNVHVAGYMSAGAQDFFGHKPLKVPSDLKGLKIRVNSPVAAQAVKVVGGAPVFMSSNDLYQAVQRRTVDAFAIPSSSIMERKLYEVSKYGVDTNQDFAIGTFAINNDKWEALPKRLRSQIEAATVEIQKDSFTGWAKDEMQKVKEMRDKGVKFQKLTPQEQQAWADAMHPAWDAYFSDSGSEGRSLVKTVQGILGGN